MMMYVSASLLILAVLSALMGFTGLIRESAGIAQILFFLFLGLFIATILPKGPPPTRV